VVAQKLVIDIRSLPKYKSLIRNLVGRDLKVKYRDSLMGYLWSMLNPLMMIITYIVAFKYILGMRDVSAPRIIVGVAVWTFCGITVTSSANSLLRSAQLLHKVAFPRIVPVISNQLFCLIQHVIVYPFLIIGLFFLKCPVSLNWFYVIVVLILLNLMLFGMGMFLAALTVFFRDIQHFLAIAMRILFWFTPIIYPISKMQGRTILYYIVAYSPFSPFIRSMTRVFCTGKGLTAECSIQMAAYTIVALVCGFVCFYSLQHRFMEEI